MTGTATLSKGYLGSSLVVGGVRYMRDTAVSDIPGLTADEIAFYRSRGIINDRRMSERGSLARPPFRAPVTKDASKPVGPMTTGDMPGSGAPAPAPAPSPAPAPAPSEAPAPAPASDAAARLAALQSSAMADLGADASGDDDTTQPADTSPAPSISSTKGKRNGK